MRNENKVLACVDQSHFADYVADYAAWASERMEAPLELLHVFDRHPEVGSGKDHSGAIGIDAQEHLLTELAAEDENRTRKARETGRLFLNKLRERALAAGVESVDVRLRQGELVETLAEQEVNVRLMVLGRRGEAAESTQRDLGRNVESVLRTLKKPILTVSEAFHVPKRAMVAFDGGIVTRRGVELVAKSPLLRGMPIHLLMSGKERSDAPKQLDWAKSTLEAEGFDTKASLILGDAERIICESIKSENIDLLIMGAYAHSPIRSLLFGSKTTDLLRSTAIPTLIVR